MVQTMAYFGVAFATLLAFAAAHLAGAMVASVTFAMRGVDPYDHATLMPLIARAAPRVRAFAAVVAVTVGAWLLARVMGEA
jgi:hypothetical protein